MPAISIKRLHRNVDGVWDIWRDQISKTANYVVKGKDNGALFDNAGATGAVTFTLPPLKSGYVLGFLCKANQNLTITSAEGNNIVCTNNPIGNSLTFSTSSQKVGSFVCIYSDAGGTAWLVEQYSPNTMAVS